MAKIPKNLAKIFSLLLFYSLSFKTLAQENVSLTEPEIPVKVNAREMTYDRKNEIINLLGDVVIKNPPWTIYAQEIQIDLKTNIIHCPENVKVIKTEQDQEKEVILADLAEINFKTNAGYLVNAKMIFPTKPVKANQEFNPPIGPGETTISGDRIEKISDNLYLFKQASFTSCQCAYNEKPDWAFSAKEITADTEGVAKLHSVRILIAGKKVFYIPYYEFPLSDKRKSGLLPPEFGYSNQSGYYGMLPSYLVLSQSADLTIYPTWFSERGFQPGAQFRYNLGDISTGQLEGFAIQDQKDNKDRWSVIYLGESSWNNGYLREDIRLLSDNEYIRDFPQNLSERWQRELDSKIILGQNFPSSSLSGEFKWVDDLAGWEIRERKTLREDMDSMVIQQLPSVSYQVFNRKISGPLGFDIRGFSANYWRENDESARAVSAGLFPRLTLAPELIPSLRIFSFAGYQLSAFSPYYESFEEKTELFTRPLAGADLSLALEKIYGADKTEGNKYRHLLEPAIVVIYQGKAQEPENEFLETIADFEEKGLVGVRLTSLLFQKQLSQTEPVSKLTSEFEMVEFYDWVNDSLTDLQLRGFVGFPELFGIDTALFYDTQAQEWHRGLATLWLQDKRKDRFSIRYVYTDDEIQSHWYSYKQENAENWLGGVNLLITNNLGLNYSINYSARYESVDSQTLSFNYLAKQKCWALTVKLSQNINPEDPNDKPDYSGSLFFQLLAGNQPALGPEWYSLQNLNRIP